MSAPSISQDNLLRIFAVCHAAWSCRKWGGALWHTLGPAGDQLIGLSLTTARQDFESTFSTLTGRNRNHFFNPFSKTHQINMNYIMSWLGKSTIIVIITHYKHSTNSMRVIHPTPTLSDWSSAATCSPGTRAPGALGALGAPVKTTNSEWWSTSWGRLRLWVFTTHISNIIQPTSNHMVQAKRTQETYRTYRLRST